MKVHVCIGVNCLRFSLVYGSWRNLNETEKHRAVPLFFIYMRKLFFVLLLLLTKLSAFAYDFEKDGIYFSFISQSDGTVQVALPPSRGLYSGDVNIPSNVTYNDASYDVIKIGDYAFEDCSELTSITIPNSVTAIGSYAFKGCSGLTTISIPNSVTDIGGSAFYGCSGLKTISIPNSVKYIGIWAFSYCTGLMSASIGDSVTDINSYAFNNCESLTTVTIGNSVKMIGYNAFFGCHSLISVVIPNSVTTISEAAFAGCRNITSVTIPRSVTSIAKDAFKDCSGLKSVNITDVESWCKIKFSNEFSNPLYYAHDLYLNGSPVTDVVFPDNNTEVNAYTFRNCTSLTSVIIPSPVSSIGGAAFSGCTNLTSVSIPNSVTYINEHAFSGCVNLTSVNVADYESWCNIWFVASTSNPLSNGGNLYINGTLVTDVCIPSSVTWIKQYAFAGFSNLASVKIPNSVTEIGRYAFSGCHNLTSVIIPQSVRIIDTKAFYDCTRLTSIINYRSTPQYINSAETFTNYGTLHVLPGCKAAYEAADYWKKFTIVEIPTIASGSCGDNLTWSLTNDYTLTILGEGFMTNWDSADDVPWHSYTEQIVRLSIGDKVKSIGDRAFHGCYNISSAIIPNSVTSIGDDTFEFCGGLTSITLPNSLKSIGIQAFNDCGLTSITIPNSVTNIGIQAFGYCSDLASVSIPNSVTSIGSWAFRECTGLTSVTIPNSVTKLGDGTFNGCSGLSLITIPNTVTSIGSYCFENCSGLTSVTIPNAVTSIGASAFHNCRGLTSLRIPNTVTSIGNNSFVGCSGLTSVQVDEGNLNYCSEDNVIYTKDKTTLLYYMTSKDGDFVIPNSVTSIGNYAFYNCDGLTSVIIPNSVTSIGYSAFEQCYKLTSVTNYATTPQEIDSRTFYVMGNNYVLHVLPECKSAYESAAYWKKFNVVGDIYIYTLTDGEVFTNPEEKECISITYNRNFKDTNWTPLFIPFEISYNDWKDDFDVARLNPHCSV